jgi:hypothetical protein
VTVTPDTVDDAEEARPEPDCALITDANVWPFCRRLILFADGVVGLKKATQFALISATAADEPPLAEADGAADVADAMAGGFVPGLGGLLPHAATAAATMTPSAQTRKNREPTRGNRIRALLWLL